MDLDRARARIAELNAFANFVETFADREPLLSLCRTSHFRHELFPKTLGNLLFLRVPQDHHP